MELSDNERRTLDIEISEPEPDDGDDYYGEKQEQEEGEEEGRFDRAESGQE